MKQYHTVSQGYISKSETLYQGEKELSKLEERIYDTFLNGNSGERELLSDEYDEMKRRMNIVKSVKSYNDAVEWEELYEKAYNNDLLKTIPNRIISKSALNELSKKVQYLKDKLLDSDVSKYDKDEHDEEVGRIVKDGKGVFYRSFDY